MVDVRRHVDDVAGARHQRQQAIGFRLGALRRVGRLPQVNPVGAARPDDSGVRASTRSSDAWTSRVSGVRHAVARPVVPRPQVHQRFGVERRARRGRRGTASTSARHRLGVGAIGRLPVRRPCPCSARRARRCRRARAAWRRAFSATAFCASASAFGSSSGIHRRVDVRPEHERLTPVRHRAATDRAAPPRRRRGPPRRD